MSDLIVPPEPTADEPVAAVEPAVAVVPAPAAAPAPEAYPPVSEDPQELVLELERWEAAPQLSHDQFRRYVEVEEAFEAILMGRAGYSAEHFHHDDAADGLQQVAEMNLQVSRLAERELDRIGDGDDVSSADSAYREDLKGWRDETTAFAALMAGESRLAASRDAYRTGDLGTAMQHKEAARAMFASISGDDLAEETGAFRVECADIWGQFLSAVQEARRGSHEAARNNFHDVWSSYEALDETAKRLPGEHPLIEWIQAEVSGQVGYIRSQYHFVSGVYYVKAGNFDLAQEYMTDALGDYAAWQRQLMNAGLEREGQQLLEVEAHYMQGWASWTAAEHNLDLANWRECRTKVREARQHWARYHRTASQQVLLGMMAQSFEVATLEILLQNTLRRCNSEERLHLHIEELREEKRNLRPTIIANAQAHGGTNIVSQPQESTQNTYNVQAGAVGGVGQNNTVSGPVTGTQNITNNAVDPALAGELRRLLDTLRAGASTDAERAAADSVQAAEQAAQNGDAQTATGHLRAAGRWALQIAQALGLTVAAAAIGGAIGV